MDASRLEQLLNSVLAGDREPLNELLEWVQSVVADTLRKRASWLSASDSDDIVQQSLIAITSSLPRLKDRACFVSWVKCIAFREFCNWLKKRRPRLPRDEETDLGSIPAPVSFDASVTSIDPTMAVEFEDQVNVLIKLLKPRQVVILQYRFRGLNIQEISDATGYTRDVVHDELERIRLIYRRRFGK
jgi:RNA polymerase sigma factor (sigma-70 family)